jgi:hypothetical protein
MFKAHRLAGLRAHGGGVWRGPGRRGRQASFSIAWHVVAALDGSCDSLRTVECFGAVLGSVALLADGIASEQ